MSVTPRARTVRAVLAAGAVVTAVLLSGCASTVRLDPAPHAGAPGCADVVVRLPDQVANLTRRGTDAQSTAAWGNPTAVLLRCGVPVPGPTTLPCLTVDGVDWIRDDSNAPDYRFITYGRSPAIEVIVDDKRATGSTALVDLTAAVRVVPQRRHCVGAVQEQE